jgi:hypothetical protein
MTTDLLDTLTAQAFHPFLIFGSRYVLRSILFILKRQGLYLSREGINPRPANRKRACLIRNRGGDCAAGTAGPENPRVFPGAPAAPFFKPAARRKKEAKKPSPGAASSAEKPRGRVFQITITV